MRAQVTQSLSSRLGLRHSRFVGRHEEACLWIVRTGEALTKRGDRLLAPFKLTVQQFNILIVLRHEGGEDGLSQVALGRHLLLSPPNVSLALKRLVARGLVRKAKVPGSARERRITLAPAGERLMARAEPHYDRELARTMAAQTPADWDKVCALMAKLWDGWDAPPRRLPKVGSRQRPVSKGIMPANR